MVSLKIPTGYLLRLDHGEELVRSITAFCEQNQITAGWISGLGSALWADLAFYHQESKSYEYDKIDEPLEVAALNGNISQVNGKPFVHLHTTVGDMNYHSYSGHVKEIAVGSTFEIKIDVFEGSISRVHNDTCGLKILDFNGN